MSSGDSYCTCGHLHEDHTFAGECHAKGCGCGFLGDDVLASLYAGDSDAPVAEDKREWQVAVGSKMLHVIDTSLPGSHTPTGERRRSGPRALCGRYPQRNNEFPWWSWPVSKMNKDSGRSYMLTRCHDCTDALSDEETR